MDEIEWRKGFARLYSPVGGLGTRVPSRDEGDAEGNAAGGRQAASSSTRSEEAAAAGIEHFIFVTGRAKQAIEDHFDISFELENTLQERGASDRLAEIQAARPGPGRVAYTRQGEPRGLGHAVWCARDLVGDEPFAVLLADDLVLSDTPCLKQLIEIHDETGETLSPRKMCRVHKQIATESSMWTATTVASPWSRRW